MIIKFVEGIILCANVCHRGAMWDAMSVSDARMARLEPRMDHFCGFKDKTECITIYMSRSSFIHIVTL